MKVRKVIAYKQYFENFLLQQPTKVQDKIFKIIEAIETLERVPANYLKSLVGIKDLYEVRYNWGLIYGAYFVFLMKIN